METLFWNVDTQYDFMRSEGLLYIPDAEKIENNLEKLTGLAKSRNLKVVNTADWHNESSEELSEDPDFIKTFPKHCMAYTEGVKFVPATDPEDPHRIFWEQDNFNLSAMMGSRNIVLYKDKFDVFSGTPHAEKVLENLAPNRAVVYGVATNVCVDFAVMGLLERDIQVYVPTDAIKELPNLPLPYEQWEKKGAILTTTEKIYEMLEENK